MSMMKGKKLNEDLDVSGFRICVPITCRLELARAESPRPNAGKNGEQQKKAMKNSWREYFTDDLGVGRDVDVADVTGDLYYVRKSQSFIGAEGWAIRGQVALAHALRVHQCLKADILRLPGVSAVDVGFAVEEGNRRFDSSVALRVHVNEKRSRRLLEAAGHSDLTSPSFLIASFAHRYGDESQLPELEIDFWKTAGRWRKLVPYLNRFVNSEDEVSSFGTFDERLESISVRPESLREKIAQAGLRYPIRGVGFGDFGCYPFDPESQRAAVESERPNPEAELPRLTICGVPLDIIGVQYEPFMASRRRPRAGVFIGERGTASELSDEEQERTGQDRVEPLVGGVSVGSAIGRDGTLGLIVWDRTDGKPCILSNWHVLAGSTAAQVGQPIFQPSLFDGGNEGDVVAHLERWYLGIHGDAALAKLSGARSYVSGEVLGMWHPLSGMMKPELGMRVRKWGRSTGFTEGFVDGIRMAVNIDFGGVSRRFDRQFHIAPLYAGMPVSQSGDSGSVAFASFDLSELFLCRETLEQAIEGSAEDPGEHLKSAAYQVLEKSGRALEADGVLERIAGVGPKDPGLTVEGTLILDPELSAGIRSETSGRTLPTFRTDDLSEPVKRFLERQGFDVEAALSRSLDRDRRGKLRIYFAVGLIFAGDTPGSPFGEFAIASDIGTLAEELKFSLRPVFAPRTGFREIVAEGGDFAARSGTRGARLVRSLAPGELGSDDDGSGPGGDPEKSQSGT